MGKEQDPIVVYIASPYTMGDHEMNVRRQIDAAERLAEIGLVPLCPLWCHYWDIVYPHDWQFWMYQTSEWLRRSDVLLRLLGESKGADIEVTLAQQLRIPVYFNCEALVEDYQADRIH